MIEYRFLCVDVQGRWQDVRYATLADDGEARTFGCQLLRSYAAVIVFAGERKLVTLAQIA